MEEINAINYAYTLGIVVGVYVPHLVARFSGVPSLHLGHCVVVGVVVSMFIF